MKKIYLLILIALISVLSSCAAKSTTTEKTTIYTTTVETTTAHVCNHVCPTCGYCLDETCEDPVCSIKCQGHVVLTQEYEGQVDGINFKLPALGDSVSIHTELQSSYLSTRYYARAYNYVDGTKEESHPLPVSFTFKCSKSSDSYILQISESEDFTDCLTYETSEKEIDIYNLKIGTTYYWNITVDGVTSGNAIFTTESGGPRNLYIDGITNARDIGGWETSTGKEFIQGMVFRSTKLTENYSDKCLITADGIKTEREVLHIKSEIDLRGATDNGDIPENGGITKSVLGDDVNYYYYPMQYVGNTLIANKDMVVALFNEVLPVESNYPMTIHCSAGADRAGMVCFLIGALCGTKEECLYRDYLFTNFCLAGSYRDLNTMLNLYVKYIKTYEGETIQENTYNCLLDLGVTKENLDKIISILTR